MLTLKEIRKRERWLIKNKYRPSSIHNKRIYCFNKGGHKFRINRHGDVDMSCSHADFDRWANSTEKTWTFEEFKNV